MLAIDAGGLGSTWSRLACFTVTNDSDALNRQIVAMALGTGNDRLHRPGRCVVVRDPSRRFESQPCVSSGSEQTRAPTSHTLTP